MGRTFRLGMGQMWVQGGEVEANLVRAEGMIDVIEGILEFFSTGHRNTSSHRLPRWRCVEL